MIHRRAFMAALASLLVAGSAHADEEARRLLLGIYKAYSGEDTPGVDFGTDAKARRYFTPEMVRLIAQDRTKPGASMRSDTVLDFDPFVNSQEWNVSDFDVTVEPVAADRVTATAKIMNFGEPVTITHDMVRTPQGWRIADIRWAGDDVSLRAMLSKRKR